VRILSGRGFSLAKFTSASLQTAQCEGRDRRREGIERRGTSSDSCKGEESQYIRRSSPPLRKSERKKVSPFLENMLQFQYYYDTMSTDRRDDTSKNIER
jgi:hypothetical protein